MGVIGVLLVCVRVCLRSLPHKHGFLHDVTTGTSVLHFQWCCHDNLDRVTGLQHSRLAD